MKVFWVKDARPKFENENNENENMQSLRRRKTNTRILQTPDQQGRTPEPMPDVHCGAKEKAL
jgi:hypothetical protein